MNLHYQYYWFKEVIPHDVCDKIIKMGNEQIELVKKEGGDASGTTRGGGGKIKLLDPSFVNQFVSEFELLMKESIL